MPKKVAIVGSGCSGLAALWALRDSEHEVHIYEADDRLGGHTNTVEFKHEDKRVNVDTGFIVMNTATYPNFITFLSSVGLKPVATDMTFSVSRDWGLFEWSGTSPAAIFAQKRNIFSFRMWQMIFDVIRFNQYSLDLLAFEDECEQNATRTAAGQGAPVLTSIPLRHQSIGDYLDENHYSEAFREDYLIPMTACVWSTSPDKVSLDFPAITLIRFLWNHHLLNTVTSRPQWMTIVGGSRQYIDKIVQHIPSDRIHLNAPVNAVRNVPEGIEIKFADGKKELVDHVIMATHGDTTASIIHDGASAEERSILGAFKTSENKAVLHSDRTLLPLRKIAWASWNYLTTSPAPGIQPSVCLTYNMNILQHIPTSTHGDVLVTLNPLRMPRKQTIQGQWTYRHPLYNAAAVNAQKSLAKIQNRRGISYAGAWTKYGFHEDGFSSGLKIAQDHLGAQLPFEFVDSTFSRGRKPRLGLLDYALRFCLRSIQFWLLIGSLLVRLLHRGQEAKRQKIM